MQLFIQMVWARLCNLNTNGVSPQKQFVQRRSDRPKGYTRIEKKQRQAPVLLEVRIQFSTYMAYPAFAFCMRIRPPHA